MKVLAMLTTFFVIVLFSYGNMAEDPIHVQIENHHCNITPSSSSNENFITETWHEAIDGIKTLLAPVIEEGKEIGGYIAEAEENWMDKLNKFFHSFQWILWIVAFAIIMKILVCILCCECKRKKSWGKIKMEVRKTISDGGV